MSWELEVDPLYWKPIESLTSCFEMSVHVVSQDVLRTSGMKDTGSILESGGFTIPSIHYMNDATTVSRILNEKLMNRNLWRQLRRMFENFKCPFTCDERVLVLVLNSIFKVVVDEAIMLLVVKSEVENKLLLL
jgi:hypothetical protein